MPYSVQFKLFGTYPLPGDVQLSANFQSIPGSNYSATYNAPTAEVARSLGRPLAGGARTVAVPLTQPWTLWEERINQIDIRALKGFRVKRARVEGTVDVFNLFNTASVLNQVQVYGPAFRRPTQILEGRMVKFGAKFEF